MLATVGVWGRQVHGSAAKAKAGGEGAKGKRVEPHFGAVSARLAETPQDRRAAAQAEAPFAAPCSAAFSLPSALVALIIGGGFLYFVARLPDPILLTLDDRPPNLTILASDGTVLAERGLRRGYVRLDRLPPICPAR